MSRKFQQAPQPPTHQKIMEDPAYSRIVASMVERRQVFSQLAYGSGVHQILPEARTLPDLSEANAPPAGTSLIGRSWLTPRGAGGGPAPESACSIDQTPLKRVRGSAP